MDTFYESSMDKTNAIYAHEQYDAGVRLHFHRAFELAYITEGTASYEVEGESFLAKPNQIMFSHCYYQHKCSGVPTHTKYVIVVPGNFSHDISDRFEKQTLPSLLEDTDYNKTLLVYFKKLVSEGESMSVLLKKGYVQLLFGSLLEHYDGILVKPKNRNLPIILDILNYIDQNFREHITLETLSSEFGYNKTYFSRLFNQHIRNVNKQLYKHGAL